MSWGSIGAMLLVMAVIAIVALIWFHFVEAVLGFFKKLVFRKKSPPAWHSLPKENDKEL